MMPYNNIGLVSSVEFKYFVYLIEHFEKFRNQYLYFRNNRDSKLRTIFDNEYSNAISELDDKLSKIESDINNLEILKVIGNGKLCEDIANDLNNISIEFDIVKIAVDNKLKKSENDEI